MVACSSHPSLDLVIGSHLDKTFSSFDNFVHLSLAYPSFTSCRVVMESTCDFVTGSFQLPYDSQHIFMAIDAITLLHTTSFCDMTCVGNTKLISEISSLQFRDLLLESMTGMYTGDGQHDKGKQSQKPRLHTMKIVVCSSH